MQTKMMTVESMDDRGKGLARIATLSTVDHDGDTYAQGAFGTRENGQWVPLLPAHMRSAMPFGKALVFEEGDAAFAELHINMETQAGRDWHATLKFDLEKGRSVQEWSFGYEVLDSEERRQAGGSVRVLKRLDVHEVSTVVRGAGEGTRTLHLKNASLKDKRFRALTADLTALADAVVRDSAVIGATGFKQLDDIHRALGKVLAKAQTRLSRALNARIDELAGDDDAARSALIERMADHAGIERGTVLQILRGEIETPPEERIRGFSRALRVPVAQLEGLLERSDDEAEAKAKAALEQGLAYHLTRDARRHFGHAKR